MKTILITGATSGIGEATARVFAQNAYRLILTGRREDRLQALKTELSAMTEVLTLCFDVRKLQQVKEKLGNLPENWQKIDVLLNNAGLAVGLNTLQEGEIEDWERMIDTNVKGLLYVTRTLAPNMIARKEGHIINISSTAGKEVYPNGNVYCATKHAVDALSRAMRIDMVQHNIKVTNIAPGMVETEFSLVRFKGDRDWAKSIYQNIEVLTPENVADVIFFAANQPPHVCLNDIVLTATIQANSTVVHRK
ncbi:MAG: SDR family oxidoreductase [Bacteroidia bacterium]